MERHHGHSHSSKGKHLSETNLPLASWQEAQQHGGRHDAEEGAQSSTFGSADSRKRERVTGLNF